MPEPKHYHIDFQELGEADVYVLSFKGREALTRPFLYEIELLSPNRELDASRILNKAATLRIERGTEHDPHEVHGIISRFQQRGHEPMTSYYVELVPRIWLLGLTKQNAVYQYTTLEDLIQQMMEQRDASGAGYGTEIPCRFELEQNPGLKYLVQYRESNLDFLHRRLEFFGVSYYIDHTSGEDVVVFTDNNEAYAPVDGDGALNYRAGSAAVADPKPTITNWVFEERVLTGLFRMKDYNPDTPSTSLEVESQLNSDAPGLQYEYGDNFENQDAGKALVRIRNEETLCQQKEISATSDMRAFVAGCTFTLDQHYRNEWNQPYLITAFTCEGNQWGAFGHLEGNADVVPYRNSFTAIPLDVVYRPSRKTPVPRIPGIMSAIVESNAEDDEYAFIDDAGRYKVRMLFDLLEREKTGDSSVAIRQVQPYTGNDYGIHFPNHTGTEMIWACIDGDPDRPIALGTAPNQENPSPVHAGTKTKNIIRTAGLNELTFDDKAGEELIFLNGTRDWVTNIANDNLLRIGGNEKISVRFDQSLFVRRDQHITVERDRDKTVNGEESEHIRKNKKIHVEKDHSEKIDGRMIQEIREEKTERIGGRKILSIIKNYVVSVGGDLKTKVAGGKSEEIDKASTEAIGTNKSVNAGTNITLKAGTDFSCDAGDTITLMSGGNMSLLSTGDVYLSSRKRGVINMEDELTLRVGKASITLKKNGDILMNGKKIQMKGSGNIIIKGKKILEN